MMDDDPASRLLVECKMASTDLEKLAKLMYRLGYAEGCMKGAKVMACLCKLKPGREPEPIAEEVVRVYARPEMVRNELHYYSNVDAYGMMEPPSLLVRKRLLTSDSNSTKPCVRFKPVEKQTQETERQSLTQAECNARRIQKPRERDLY